MCNIIEKSAKDITWVRTGGIVQVFEPNSIEELKDFLKHHKNFVVLGFGSNVIVPDTNFDKIIVRLMNMRNSVKFEQHDNAENVVIADAGVSNMECVNFCIEHGLSNLEFMRTIPGTIGGALYMNAGAYGTCVADHLVYAEIMDSYGQIHRLRRSEIQYEYRSSNIAKDSIFLRGCFKVVHGDKENIKSCVEKMREYRNTVQPRVNTFGSVFKNPPNMNSWKLITEAGCHKMKVGGAHISELHANFIINDGAATSEDIKKLIQQVQTKVFEKTGIMLEREVVYV